MTAAAAIRGPLLRLGLLAVLSWQVASHTNQKAPAVRPSTFEELSTSLVVNQLAILQLMQDSSNASCAAAEMRRESDADREEAKRLEGAMGAHVDRVVVAQQQHMQQMLGALNNSTLTRVEELREEMRELAKIVQEEQELGSQATLPLTEATAVPEVAYLGPIVHNDTLPSICGGNKTLHGTIGSLEVVKNGTYPKDKLCSWSLNFPKESSVSLTWDYIDVEETSTCSYDWVEVLDVTHDSQPVFGRKLCGTLDSTTLKLLNVMVHGTRNLLVTFHSDGSREKRGFRMFYHAL